MTTSISDTKEQIAARPKEGEVDDQEDWEKDDDETTGSQTIKPPSNLKATAPTTSRRAMLNNLRASAPVFKPPPSLIPTFAETGRKSGAISLLNGSTAGLKAESEKKLNGEGPNSGPGTLGKENGKGKEEEKVGKEGNGSSNEDDAISLPGGPSTTPNLMKRKETQSTSTSSSTNPFSTSNPSPTTTTILPNSRPTLLTRPNPNSNNASTPPNNFRNATSSSSSSSISGTGDGPSTPASTSELSPLHSASEAGLSANVDRSIRAGVGAGKNGGDDDDPWNMNRLPGQQNVSNRQIWSAANSSTSTSTSPLPTPPTSTDPNTPSLPPLPSQSLRILRRGNSPSSASQAALALAAAAEKDKEKRQKTLEEREEEYKRARERIFGVSASSSSGDGGTPGSTEEGLDGGGAISAAISSVGEEDIGKSGIGIDESEDSTLAKGVNNLAVTERGVTRNAATSASASPASGEKEGDLKGKGKESDGGGEIDDGSLNKRSESSSSSSRRSTPAPGIAPSSGSALSNNSNNASSSSNVPNHPTLNTDRKVSNPGGSRRPARGEGSTFEMLRPPPDSAYRVSERNRGVGGMSAPMGGGGGGYGGYGMPGMGMGMAGGGVIRQPLGPDDAGSVGFGGQRYGNQAGGGGMNGIPGGSGGGSGFDYANIYGVPPNQYQQAAYMQQQQNAQMLMHMQQMQMSGMMTPQMQAQMYAMMGGYGGYEHQQAAMGMGMGTTMGMGMGVGGGAGPGMGYGNASGFPPVASGAGMQGGLYGIGSASNSGPSQQKIGNNRSSSTTSLDNDMGFLQGPSPTGLASSMTSASGEEEDEDGLEAAFIVKPAKRDAATANASLSASASGMGPTAGQSDFPPLGGGLGNTSRPAPLSNSSRSSSSSGSKSGKPRAWGPRS